MLAQPAKSVPDTARLFDSSARTVPDTARPDLFDGDLLYKFKPPPRLCESLFKYCALRLIDQELARRVLDGLKDGGHWRTGCQLDGKVRQDNSIPLSKEAEAKAKAKLMEDVVRGFVAGPFDECPFPNTQCAKEAIIGRLFTILKSKWDPLCTAIRLIVHKSYPKGESINDFTGRADSDYPYYTFRKFVSKLAKAGRGCSVFLADVRFAFKLLTYAREDWWQQVLKVGGKYYVDMTGVFGTVTAGDSWNWLMTFVLMSDEVLGIPGVSAFVDNLDHVLPPSFPWLPSAQVSQSSLVVS